MKAPSPLAGEVAGQGRRGDWMERHVAASFLFPLRGGRPTLRRWVLGVLLTAVFPLTFVAVFGYAVACVRAAACDPRGGPPPWRAGWRLLGDGCWSALQSAVITLPCAALGWALLAGISGAWRPTGDVFVDRALALTVAACVAAVPWGVLMLVVVPPTLARFALSGRPADLAGLSAVGRCVRDRYADWNLVIVAITTAWLLALAGLALAGVGVIAGAFYAILVSAHACAALGPESRGGP